MLQYAIGGIGALGGKLTGNIIGKLVTNIDSALLRVAVSLPIRMAGEGAEEYLQEILEPVYRNIAFDENNEFRIWSADAMYSFMLGALTAGVLEAGPAISHDITATQAGNAVIQANRQNALVEHALTLNPKTKAYTLAERLASGKTKANNYNVGTLMMEYTSAKGDISFMYTPNVDTTKQSITALNGEIFVEADTVQAEPDMQLHTAVQASIEENVRTNPETAQTALMEGMSVLVGIESRIKADSGNINHQGLSLDNVLGEYFSYFKETTL